eukprot:743203-Pyramimonas_sp.AAC.1
MLEDCAARGIPKHVVQCLGGRSWHCLTAVLSQLRSCNHCPSVVRCRACASGAANHSAVATANSNWGP